MALSPKEKLGLLLAVGSCLTITEKLIAGTCPLDEKAIKGINTVLSLAEIEPISEQTPENEILLKARTARQKIFDMALSSAAA